MSSLCQNTAAPLMMAITNNFVNPAQNAAPAWGLSVSLGQPAQPFSIRPSIDDFTLVALSDNCLSTTDYTCMSRRGGVYNPDLSTTDTNSTNMDYWNGTIDKYDETLFDYHNDMLTLAFNKTKIWGWPFVTDDSDLWGKSLSLQKTCVMHRLT